MAQMTVNVDESGFLRCHQCGVAWARLQGNILMVQSMHHGKQHVNMVTIEELANLVYNREQKQPADAMRRTQDTIR